MLLDTSMKKVSTEHKLERALSQSEGDNVLFFIFALIGYDIAKEVKRVFTDNTPINTLEDLIG